MPEMRNCN